MENFLNCDAAPVNGSQCSTASRGSAAIDVLNWHYYETSGKAEDLLSDAHCPLLLLREGGIPEPVVEFWDLISKQDWGVCERAQTGVGSRAFTTGIYPRQDRFLYDFNERYRKEMGKALLG